MANTTLIHRAWALFRFSPRAKPLSPSRSRLSDPHRKKLALAIPLLALALLLARWAHEASQTSALEEWNSQHAPSPKIWKLRMAAFAFQPVESERTILKTLGNMSGLTPQPTASYWNETARCLAVFEKEVISIPSLVFCEKAAPTGDTQAMSWTFLGLGWNGLEAAEVQIQRLQSRTSAARRPHFSSDPREIRY